MDHVCKDELHGPLISSTSIFQPKRHYNIKKNSNRSVKSSFLLILMCHSDLIIATEAVLEGKHFMANYIVKQDVRNR